MLSAALAAHQQGISLHCNVNVGQNIKVLYGTGINKTFVGVIYEQPALDPDMPLGADPRMTSFLEVAPQLPPYQPAPVFTGGETIRIEAGTIYKILALHDNNAVGLTVTYRIEQQV